MVWKTKRIILATLLIGTAVTSLGASGVSAQVAGPTPIQAECSLAEDGGVSVSIAENQPIPDSGIIVERSRDGGRFWWRFRFSQSERTFVDPTPAGSTYEYRVRANDPTLYSSFPCGVADLNGGTTTPEVCVVILKADGQIDVVGSLGRQMVDRVVFRRSIDGGPAHWRGLGQLLQIGGAFSFLGRDVALTGVSMTYYAEVVGPDGTRSEPIQCGEPVEFAGADAQPPMRCSFKLGSDEIGVEWQPSVLNGPGSHVIYRRIGPDQPTYWRGRVSGPPQFLDTTPAWTTADQIEYEVVFVSDLGPRSEPTQCERRAAFEGATNLAEIITHPDYTDEHARALSTFTLGFGLVPNFQEALLTIQTVEEFGPVQQGVSISNSPAFDEIYGGTTNPEFVQLLYLNGYGRQGPGENIEYWADVLAQGFSRGEVLSWFAGSPEVLVRFGY